jgi:serine/threonine-protein kinase HipA
MLDMAGQTEAVIVRVTAELPDDFPGTISQAIFNGLSGQAVRLIR